MALNSSITLNLVLTLQLDQALVTTYTKLKPASCNKYWDHGQVLQESDFQERYCVF